MTPLIVLIIVLLLVGGGFGPWWGYSRGWGYQPVGGLIVIIVVLYLLFGRTAFGAEPCGLPALGVRVIDGDTIVVETNMLGVGHIRLKDIDAPELTGPCKQERDLALAAKERVEQMVKLGTKLELHDIGPDKYGRVLATVMVNNQSIGDILVAAGLARPYTGGARQPWC
jgi:micrococcal nuclease